MDDSWPIGTLLTSCNILNILKNTISKEKITDVFTKRKHRLHFLSFIIFNRFIISYVKYI